MSEKTFSEQIDDYKDSIFALIGFINLLRFDDSTRTMRDDIKISQGRRMRTSASNRITPNNEVTPDLCIQDGNNKGIIGEVKKSFPIDQSLWMQDFKQLMSYDDDLVNWPNSSGKIDGHDIVLLPHLTRSRAVRLYLEKHKDREIEFTRSFVIVEFSRLEEAKTFVMFRKEYGEFRYFRELDRRLGETGIPIPLDTLISIYGKVKLYDSMPPLPYLLALIWESVIMRRAVDADAERFAELRKNSKLPVQITVDEIVEELHDNYSFKQLNEDRDNDLHQPQIPTKSWIIDSIDALSSFGLAKWRDKARGECTVLFTKKFDHALQDFIELCTDEGLGLEERQLTLFETSEDAGEDI